MQLLKSSNNLHISIHVLRVEDDQIPDEWNPADQLFQSTSSVWRTTAAVGVDNVGELFQSTSSVWRTTPLEEAWDLRLDISIHVLRVEDDLRLSTMHRMT